jgi:imidazolonepropionase-like amidohydrolase
MTINPSQKFQHGAFSMIQRLTVATFCLAFPLAASATLPPSDYVLTDARIYTEDAARSTAQALAVKDGKIVYVGDAAGAKALIGPATRVEQGGGRLVLPGLVDAHIHPTGIADLDVCSLEAGASPSTPWFRSSGAASNATASSRANG